MKDMRPLGAVISAAIAGAVIGAILLFGLNAQMSQLVAENQAEARGIGTTQFTSAVVFKEPITVNRESTFTGAMTAAAITSSGAVSGATLASTGAATVGTFEVLTAGTAITVTDGAVFSPTTTYQKIQAAGAVTPTIGLTSTATAGTKLILENISAQNILFADSGTQVLGGARTLGQYDILALIFDGTAWVELGFVNN